jgi:outer membrane receptor for ferrienterochelin and colicins
MIRKICFAVLQIVLFLCPVISQAQERTVRVFNAASSEPLHGARVMLDFRPEGPMLDLDTDTSGSVNFQQQGACAVSVFMTEFKPWHGSFTVHENFFVVYLQPIDQRNDPVVITASVAPTAASQSANQVRVIQRDKIERMAAQNLSELLSNEVNIAMGQDAVLGSSAIMQGISGQNIKILMNGVPVIGRLNGSIDVSQINLSLVERIEIIEGPMSALFGTDALGGVINIITRNAAKKGTETRANLYMDGLGNYNADLTLSQRLNKHFSYNLNAGRHFFDGVDYNPETRIVDWKPKTRYFAEGGFFLRTGKAVHRVQSQYFRERLTDRQEAQYSNLNITGFNHIFHSTRFDNNWHLRLPLTRNVSFEMLNAWNIYSRRRDVVRRDLVTGEERDLTAFLGDSSRFSMQMSRGYFTYSSPRSRISWLAGYETNYENGRGDNMPADSRGIHDVALYGISDIKMARGLVVRPGLRFIHNDRFGTPLATDGLLSSIRMAPLIPSVQLRYEGIQDVVFRAALSRGYRAPGLKELNILFVDNLHNVRGNEDLKAEHSTNLHAGLEYRRKINTRCNLNINYSIFHNEIRDRINLAMVDAATNLYTYINIGQYSSQGINFNAEFNHQRYSVTAGASTIGVQDNLQPDSLPRQEYFYFTQMRLNGMYRIPKAGITISMFNKYSGATRGYNADYTTYRISDFLLTDITVDKTFGSSGIRLSAGCRNLMNVQSVASNRVGGGPHASSDGSQLIAPGRQLFVRFSVSLTKS